MNNYYDKNIDQTATELKVNINTGLSTQEATSRVGDYGENKLESAKGKSMFQLLLAQFKDFLVLILIVAAIVSIALGHTLDGAVILLIVVLNGILGVYQENKASNALAALKKMSSPKTKVLRNGEISEIASEQTVPGDVVILEAGDYVPADMRLIESINLQIDESALTGESLPEIKDANKCLDIETTLGDRENCAYMGTVVTFGRGRGLVTETGMNGQMGKIAKLLNDTEDESTPLQKKLNSLGKILGIVCIIICILIFGLGIYHNMDPLDIFMTAVSLAVAAVPEGLTVVVTVVLAMGMQKMVKSNAIIKRLSAVETLGSTTVICSDKTGTLTQNKMTVIKLFENNNHYNVTGTGYGANGEIQGGMPTLNPSIKRLLEGAALCNDSLYNIAEEKIIGDPTEGALLVVAKKAGFVKDELNRSMPRINELAFDSDRKLMSTFHQFGDKVLMYTKGAPDEILRRSRFIYKDGEAHPITDEEKSEISAANNSYADNALRVLAVAYRDLNEATDVIGKEEDLVFVGLLGMIDPPREEAKDAISLCKTAGIKVKMITGDHVITAGAIGRELGILSDDGAMEGREIDLLSDEELQEKVKTVNVFARVSPEHKVRLVTAIRKNGDIAAMTGDGVNDAPSLKRADIGIAMGITGTDVSKEAADMILTDDNFASIVSAVEEGRTIYSNIRKVVGYLLSCNIGEILVIFTAMLFAWPVPLASIQLLMINLITDAFPAFALGMEEKEAGVMIAPPRDPKESIVDNTMKVSIGFQSVFLALGALLSFYYAYVNYTTFFGDYSVATTACFVTLVVGELLRAYSSRSEQVSIFKMKLFNNSYLNKTVLFSLVFLVIAVYVPFLNPIFSTTPLSASQLLICIGFGTLPLIGGEIAKLFKKKKLI